MDKPRPYVGGGEGMRLGRLTWGAVWRQRGYTRGFNAKSCYLMEGIAVLFVFFFLLVLIVLPIWTIIGVRGAKENNRRLTEQLHELERRIGRFEQALSELPKRSTARAEAPPVQTPIPAAPVVPATISRTDVLSVGPDIRPIPAVEPEPASVALPPPLPLPAVEPPPLPPSATGTLPGRVSPPLLPAEPQPTAINWERFMGVKLFAWIGGLALFLAVAFFVKYSFEHDLVPPEVRVAIGFLLSLGLVAGGLRLARKNYAVTAQTLCATGVVSLYAVTFACHAVYDFPLFGAMATFGLMALITAVAFLLAVRMEARVVAVLGILGGFLTPVLLSTGEDNPAGFFGYLALLNVGLVAVALHRRWAFLVPLGASGTLVLLLGWTERFFTVEKAAVPMFVTLGFGALFTGALAWVRRCGWESRAVAVTAVAAPFVAFGYAFYFLTFPLLAAQPGRLFLLVVLAEMLVVAVALVERGFASALRYAGGVIFLFLATWTASALTEPLLPWALAGYLGFAALHTVLPLALGRWRSEFAAGNWSQLAPPLGLLLVLAAVLKFDTVSWLVWPCVLAVDLIAIALAFFTASLVAVAAALALTLAAMGAWIFRVPAELTAPLGLLGAVGGFALLFFGAGLWLARRSGWGGEEAAGAKAGEPFDDPRAHLPACSALLPFTLLILVILRLPLVDPAPVFGLALLLVVLTLGLAWRLALEWLPLAALVGVAAVEATWLNSRFSVNAGGETIAWNLGFYAVFVAYPFVFRNLFSDTRGPWVAAALSAPPHFLFVYRAVELAWPNEAMGLLPAAFALPALVSLVLVLRATAVDAACRLERLAWFGGVALFFITLIFPIQFSRQWLTVSWALEGAALLWLFHRVPHPGLRWTGVGLLVAVFARLALNPEVLGYHPRAATPIFNWYLYTYGTAIGCFFAGARMLAPPRERVGGINVPPWLQAGAVILAFLLLNLEIADFYSEAGTTVMFRFSGHFARDMTYTIAWALFAFGLLIAGIWRTLSAARYAAIALLSVALLKLFFHDLSHLGQLYRIGALAAVAAIAILASFVYQRFLATGVKPHSE